MSFCDALPVQCREAGKKFKQMIREIAYLQREEKRGNCAARRRQIAVTVIELVSRSACQRMITSERMNGVAGLPVFCATQA